MDELAYLLGPAADAWAPLADRCASDREHPDRVAERWNDPRTRVFVCGGGRVLTQDGIPVALPVEDAPDGDRLLLGTTAEGETRFAVHVRGLRDNPDARSLRAILAGLTQEQTAFVVPGLALSNWHDGHTHCPRCGAGTVVVRAGHARECPEDGSLHFPRTDPAVIMLVVSEHGPGDPAGRCLLGHAVGWPERRFSTLAGFVEPAETVEAAVRREVAEEVGIEVGKVRYVGSQPWPFPSSLMLACYALARSTDVQPDGTEILAARWFTRAELRSAAGSGDLVLPPRVSVARRLLEGWHGGPLPGDGGWR